ncbi:MAG: hypothetical protein JJU29_15705 [Verrucomicrobia bacterium]|nr:hypothetical protein [Verrucomicrobiota bacterium]MCH8513467.1 SGNH/GDSL hydrolase family protein [Kiritimatiellia bacterium]
MKITVLTCLFFGCGFCPMITAQTRTPEELEERLEAEIATLDETRDEALAVLRTQYLGFLEQQRQEQQRAGRAEAETLIEAEKNRVREDGPLRPAQPSENPGIQRMQNILLQQIDEIEEPRTTRIRTLLQNLKLYSLQQSATLRQEGRETDAGNWETWAAGLEEKYADTIPAPREVPDRPAATLRPAPGTPAATRGGGGPTRFFRKLEAGDKPYMMIIGTSTAENPNGRVDAPWVQCAPGTRTNWPPVFSRALQDVGNVRVGGNTCAGASSSDFLDDSGRHGRHRYRQLDWVKEQNPDAVILAFAVGTDTVGRFDITLAQSRANHERIIRELREHNPEIEIFLWNEALSFNAGARNYGDDRDGSTRKSSDEPQSEYAKMCVDLANESGPGVYYIDTFSKFQKIHDDEGLSRYRTYFRDGNHTNQRGGEEVIVPEMMRVLREGNP